jgi:hypothetical protein
LVQQKLNICHNTFRQDQIFSSILIQKICYLLSFCGVLFDQLSTRIGLTHPLIFETNMFVVYLMKNGLWLYVDILAIVFCIIISHIYIKKSNFKYRNIIMFLPFTFGTLKLLTGISNFLLYFSLIQ